MSNVKISKTMSDAYDDMLSQISKAQSLDFGEWYCGSKEKFFEHMTKRVKQLGAKRVRVGVVRSRKRYDLAQHGIVFTSAGYNTVKALERRGLVEILSGYYMSGLYAVKVIDF